MDKKFRAPRVWSNKVLAELGYLFEGEIANISGWKDLDKEGKRYKDYFINSSSYFVSNYLSEARGFQGNIENEFFLNLEDNLDKKLLNKFDVVFNHTVLEHIFKVHKAFENLCLLSKDIVIVVVPFLQEQHADYGDYWRFTPLTLKNLFKENNKEMIYLNYNDIPNESIYLFAIGSSKKENWSKLINNNTNKINLKKNIGQGHIRNNLITKVLYKLNLVR